jgi:hypothetical protein
MCKMWIGLRRVIVYQSASILQLLSEPFAQLSVIELKVLQVALCDSYYDMEVNYKIEVCNSNYAPLLLNCE